MILRTCLFFKRDSFPDNCIDRINENVSFGARNLRLQKDGGAKSKQIWMNLSHWNTGGSRSLWGDCFFNLYVKVQLVKRDIVTTMTPSFQNPEKCHQFCQTYTPCD